jgi:predicted PurR-regulated permease PerM
LIAKSLMDTSARVFRDRIGAFLWMAVASAGLAFFLRATAEVFVPFTAALVIALAASPVVEWLARRKIPPALSVAMVVVLTLVLLLVTALLVQRGIDGFIQDLPKLKARAEELWSSLSQRLGVTGKPLENLGKEPSELRTIAGVGGATALSLLGILFQLLLVMLYLVFLLLGRHHLPGLLRRALGQGRAGVVLVSLARVEREILRYLFMRTAVSLMTAAAVWIILVLYGVQFAGLWALLTFFAQYVPFVGPITLSVLPVLMALVQFPSVSTAAWIALWLSILHLLVGFVLEPRVFSVGLSLNQTLVLLGLALLGWMWGILGALLWVPLMVTLRVAAQQVPGFEAVDVLLGRAAGSRGKAA